MPADLALGHFTPLIGTSFECRIPGHDGALECELREAISLPVQPGHEPPRPPFSLLFLAKTATLLPQQIYSLTHPELPEALNIFLVPVGQADGGILLEAVFN